MPPREGCNSNELKVQDLVFAISPITSVLNSTDVTVLLELEIVEMSNSPKVLIQKLARFEAPTRMFNAEVRSLVMTVCESHCIVLPPVLKTLPSEPSVKLNVLF